jgi:hypothetical protein
MLPDPSRYTRTGWVQSDELSSALRLHDQSFLMFLNLLNRIEEYPEPSIVVFKMLQIQSIWMNKDLGNWDYWQYLRDDSSESRSWSHTLRNWLSLYLSEIVQLNILSSRNTPWFRHCNVMNSPFDVYIIARWLFHRDMLSAVSDVALSRMKCAYPTITPTGTL